jgi:hypothetical protein
MGKATPERRPEMPANDKRRQKKLERRNAKRKERHREITKQRSLGLAERLRAATAHPILDSLISNTLNKDGMCTTILSRQLPTGEVAYSVFLVDTYCLGVKDAFGGVRFLDEYRQMVEKSDEKLDMKRIDPADLRYLVEQSIEYARGLGLEPHSDYARFSAIFGDIDPGQASLQVEFGKDGKPLFYAGPHDSRYKCQQIIETLRESCGDGGFDYVLPVAVLDGNPLFSLSSKGLHLSGPTESDEEP